MQKTSKKKAQGGYANSETAKSRRTDAKNTVKRDDSRPAAKTRTGSSKPESARPSRTAPDRAAPRTTPDRAAPKTTSDRPAPRADANKPRRSAAPATSRSRPPIAKVEPAKPRRVGTKLSRLLDLNVAPVQNATHKEAAKPRNAQTGNKNTTNWLMYCRAGFEIDCAQEAVAHARAQRPVLAEQPDITLNAGYAVVTINEQTLDYRELIFSRQLIRLHQTIAALPERDRLTPILNAIATMQGNFATLWLEVPDTNDGKALSAFIRRFGPLLEEALREQGRLNELTETENNSTENRQLARLHLFFPDKSSVLIGTSDQYNSSSELMGIARQSMPAEAPSRSTLKLAEAIDVFLDKSEQTRLLRSGMTAVDLGAAPGGWTWQMVKRGIRVTAVDNGPMKGVLAKHPLVEHLMQDGFKFTPRKAVDWLICDMVEKPAKVADLIGNWFVQGWCKHAIFNLKLPMKQRVVALDAALGGIRNKLNMDGISYKMVAKQLYHDREEVTVFLSKTRNR
jgi:23S rRNA (cytidine2498-2'-O)-methyltransferase